MKQTAKRILSLVLCIVVMLSTVSVYAFAKSNYTPDEDYYNNVVRDSFVVSPDWAGLEKGDVVEFEFAGKTYTENFDPATRFSTIQAAVDAAVVLGDNPVIVLLEGYYGEPTVISNNVTFVGPNGGINPVVKSQNEQEPWGRNIPYGQASLKSPIVVDFESRNDIEVTFDGVTFYHGFSFIDGRTIDAKTDVVVKNTLISGAGSTEYEDYSASAVFYFNQSRKINASVEIKDTYIEDMSSANVFSTRVTNVNVSDIFFTNSKVGLMGAADGQNDLDVSYVISDSMFYDNNALAGIISVDHSLTDSTPRSSTLLEIYNCTFLDGSNTDLEETSNTSPINVALAGTKNNVNIHDNLFVGKGNYEAAAAGYTYLSKALTEELKGTVKFNNNRLYGYCNLPDTSGINVNSYFEYSGNYFADSYGQQTDPVYKYPKSVNNLKIDYFFVDKDLKYKSSDYQISNVGIVGATVDHFEKTVQVNIPYGVKTPVNIKTNSEYTSIKLYADAELTQQVTEIDPTTLDSTKRNVFYAQSTSILYPSFEVVYTVYVTTTNPADTIEFTTAATYLVSSLVATYTTGSSYYAEWDGISYEFIVGKNAFADANDVFKLNDERPTILMQAGSYAKTIFVTKSAVILGNKHGVNPNVADFVNFDKAWELNDERNQADQETVLENAAIAFIPEATGAVLEIDGLTLGSYSVIDDRTSNDNFSSTIIVSNIIIDEAGGISYTLPGTASAISPTAIITCAPSKGKEAATTYKTGRFTNIRMVAQIGKPLFNMMAENSVIDGVYVANSTPKLFSADVTSPVTQNMHLEIRNSFFFGNTPNDYYFRVNHNLANVEGREYSNFILKHNMFYGNIANQWGIFGVLFSSAEDYTEFTDNIFASTHAKSIFPGSTGWFIGNIGTTKADVDINSQEIFNEKNFVIRYNRILGNLQTLPGVAHCNEASRVDVSYNYFSKSVGKSNEGIKASIADSRHVCDYYFTDWDMKTPAPSANDEYKKALEYVINGSGILDGTTYTDTVSVNTTTYDFDIELKSRQASYAVYSNAACTNKVTHPVQLKDGENKFYIKFSSFDEEVTETISATITKPASVVETGFTKFGSAKIEGTNIYAVVPMGTTTYTIPQTDVPVKIYNDAACTSQYTASTINNISEVPVFKYVVADGVRYTLSVLQAINDQAELISIDNATKVSDNVFKANIIDSEFELVPLYSNSATIKVVDGSKEVYKNENGNYDILNVATSKTVTITVTAENGNEQTYTLNIARGAASSKVTKIFNMSPNGESGKRFDTIVSDQIFKVEPTFEGVGTKYQVYYDKACTQPVQDNIIILEARESVAYLKAVSADNSSTTLVQLNFTCTRFGKKEAAVEKTDWTIEGATFVEGTTDQYVATVDKDRKNYKLVVNLDGAKYKKSYVEAAAYNGGERIGETALVNNKLVLPLNGRNTRYHIRIYTLEGDTPVKTERVYLTIVQPQDAVTYTDYSSIGDWAKPYVDYLNNNGYAYFVGDNNKNFNASAGISRFEAAVVVCKMLGLNTNYTHSAKSPFTDEIPEWAVPYVKLCYTLGIMAGKSETTFDGYAKTTRQEFARIISQTIAISKGDYTPINDTYGLNQALIDLNYTRKGFADEAEIADWAKPGIRLAVSYYNVMSGSAENGKLYINPTKEITRQEVAILIAKREGAK